MVYDLRFSLFWGFFFYGFGFGVFWVLGLGFFGFRV